MGIYENLRDNTAAPLIKKFGKAMVLRRTTPGAYDAATGATTASTTTDYRCWGVFKQIDLKRVDGTLIQRSDKFVGVVMENKNVSPSDSTDTLVVGSEVLKIINVETLSPGGVDILHTLQVRR